VVAWNSLLEKFFIGFSNCYLLQYWVMAYRANKNILLYLIKSVLAAAIESWIICYKNISPSQIQNLPKFPFIEYAHFQIIDKHSGKKFGHFMVPHSLIVLKTTALANRQLLVHILTMNHLFKKKNFQTYPSVSAKTFRTLNWIKTVFWGGTIQWANWFLITRRKLIHTYNIMNDKAKKTYVSFV